jgi:hypothetical protein
VISPARVKLLLVTGSLSVLVCLIAAAFGISVGQRLIPAIDIMLAIVNARFVIRWWTYLQKQAALEQMVGARLQRIFR